MLNEYFIAYPEQNFAADQLDGKLWNQFVIQFRICMVLGIDDIHISFQLYLLMRMIIIV